MAYKLPKDEVWQCMNCKWVPANPRKWVKKCKRCENIGCLCPHAEERSPARGGGKWK